MYNHNLERYNFLNSKEAKDLNLKFTFKDLILIWLNQSLAFYIQKTFSVFGLVGKSAFSIGGVF